MGIFSRRTAASPGPAEPFELLVDTVFAVPTRGHVFTGTEAAVYLGGLVRGALPVVPGGDGSLLDAEGVRGSRLVSAG